MCGGGGGPPPSEKDQKQLNEFNEELEKNKDKYRNGPISNRSITDCLCCLIFLVAILGFCGASAYGWFNGDPKKLLIGWDSDGNGCGYYDVVKDYPHLYWSQPPKFSDLEKAIKELNFELALGILQTGTCVKSCPDASADTQVECSPTSMMANSPNYPNGGCVYNMDAEFIAEMLPQEALEKYVKLFYPKGSTEDEKWAAYQEDVKNNQNSPNGLRIPFRYDTYQMYGFCLPSFDSEAVGAFGKEAIDFFVDMFREIIMNDKLTAYIADIAYTWKVIAISTVTAIVFGYLYLLIIRCCGAVIVWLSIILLQVSIIAAGVYTYMQHENYEEGDDYRDWVKYASYVIFGIAGLFFCCICCCWNAIRIGIAVYQTTAEYVSKNLRIFLLPFFTYIFAFIWLCIWLVSFIFIFSVGEPGKREVPYQFLTEIKWEDNTRYIVIYQLFMLFWINAFIMGMCQIVIAGSACIWYFEVNSDTGGSGTVGRALRWSFRYHMGSVAFGAALIAICQLIRVLFEYYRRKIQSMTRNACVRCLLCYTSYLLWLLEKCIKFITKNAYIQVMLTNTFFCKAAWNAFALILKNVARFGWLNSIGFVLNWFGVCSVAALNGFLAYIAITKIDDFKENVTQPIAPAIVVLLISFFLVKSFLSIFSFSLDAILQSFLLDESLGFAGQARPDQIAKFKTNLEKYAKPGDDGTSTKNVD